MSILVDANLIREIRSYGAFDISACFQCGNCSAVCPLSAGEASFPRKMIRLGQLGMEDELLSRQEMWLCYNCGECTSTCPRQAGPGEYMAALRRWAVGRFESTGLSAWMFRSPVAALAGTLGLALVLAGLLLTARPRHDFPDWIFKLVPYDAIHLVGMVLGGVLALGLGASVLRFVLRALKARPGLLKKGWKEHRAAALALHHELWTMRRQRPEAGQGSWNSPWAVHLAVLFGFFGLLAATTSDFLFIFLLGTKIYWPARVLGTVSGLALMAGVSAAILRRWRGADAGVRHSHLSDWWLLAFLWVLGFTGFWLEAAVTFRWTAPLHSWVLLLHTVMAMELVLLAGSTKLAHAFYRPLSLYFHFLSGGESPSRPCA